MSGVVVPIWATGPLALALMGAVMVHLLVLAPRVEPASRRRIRTVNGWVMLVAVPMVAAGFSVVSPTTQPAVWVLVWMVAIGLIVLAVLLAVIDAANTVRLHRRLRDHLRQGMEGEVESGSLRGASGDADG